MVIRRSLTREVQELVADVVSGAGEGTDVRREAAVARLRVIGDRAVRQVVTALDAASTMDARVALLRVLEGRREAAVSAAVARALEAPEAPVRAAAVVVARGLVDEGDAPDLLGRLAALAVADDEAPEVRRAAVGALATVPGAAARAVLERLATDADPAIRLAAAAPSSSEEGPGAEIEDAANGQLPADPSRLLDVLARDGRIVPLPTLHRLVGALRERESRERRDAGRRDWLTVRGAVHHALAVRESRVALYDLRETIEAAREPLPRSFTDALGAIGDPACLDLLAARYAVASDDSWRTALSAAAATIAARERLTARGSVLKRLRTKHGDDLVRRLLGS